MPDLVHLGVTGNSPSVHVYVFRVWEGLGNAILLRFPDETCAIVDWGTEKDEPLEIALSIAKQGRVRVVAVTHDHADHTVGLVRLLETFVAAGVKIDQFVYPTSQLRDLDELSKARVKARDLGIPIHPVHVRTNPKGVWAPDSLDWEDGFWELMVLAPLDTDAASNEVRSFQKGKPAGNPTSLVVLFAFDSASSSDSPGQGKILLTGDATGRVLRTASEVASQSGLTLDSQLLVIPHHGGVSVVPEWLEPNIHGIAVISARTNSPHHPKQATLQQLARRTCQGEEKKLYCTSYAQACRTEFAEQAQGSDVHLVGEGPCFGHLVIRVPRQGRATLEASSAAGEGRRRYGWCGNPTR
jgi:beta-lactamase superfamily II metal-dependent hydrolase